MHTIINTIRNRAHVGVAATALLLSPHVTQAQTTWTGFLLGTNEVPPNASTATGFVSLTLIANSLSVQVNFSGLIGGNAVAAHIHCCTAPGSNAGVAIGLTGFPSAQTGTYSNTFDLTQTSTYSGAFLTASGGTANGAQAALFAGLNAGRAYVNVHNSTYPGGEIRANVTSVVPEPASALLLGAGLLGLGGIAARKRQRKV